MNRRRTPVLGTIATIAAVVALVTAALLMLPAQATPPDKVATTMIGIGRFTNIDATAKTDVDPGTPTSSGRPGSRPREALISMCCRTRSPQAGPSAGTATPAPAW